MYAIPAACLVALRQLLQPEDILDAATLAGLTPGWHPQNFGAGLAVRPRQVAEVAAILKLCNQHRVPVVTHGGRTGLVDGGVSRPGEIVLMTERLDRIVDIDPVSMTATVEAGVTLQALQTAAAPHRLSPGIDLGARGSCTIGGMISTNAGGIEAFRNGVMRQRILGLEAVTADGQVMSDLTRVTKATVGVDLKQLFIGSEGILGVVTRAVVRLAPMPRFRLTTLVASPSAAAALRIVGAIGPAGLLAAEVMWQDYFSATIAAIGPSRLGSFADAPLSVLIEVTGDNEEAAREALEGLLALAIDSGDAIDAVVAKNETERAELWRLRDDVFVAEAGWPHVAWFDVSVPLGYLDAYVSGLQQRLRALLPAGRAFAVAHLADGNVHVTVADRAPFDERQVEDAVYAGIVAAGGAFSAEHGIGSAKLAALGRLASPVKLQLMAVLKRTLDPNGILNPGKILESNSC